MKFNILKSKLKLRVYDFKRKSQYNITPEYIKQIWRDI
jgi:hypothetical protein